MAKIGRPDCRDKVLQVLPGHVSVIAKRANVSVSSAGKWLRILNEEGVVYIAKWIERRNGPVASYKLKTKETQLDAPKPAPKTDAEHQRRFKERHPGRREEIREAYEQRVKAKALQHKQRLAAWAAPLTTVVSKSW